MDTTNAICDVAVGQRHAGNLLAKWHKGRWRKENDSEVQVNLLLVQFSN
jgi:hypothetical protein